MISEIIEKPMGAECTMKQYEAIPDADFVENREYQLTDYPDNGANATQMAFALTCQRLFPSGSIVTFSGETDSNYTNGHLYQIEVDNSGTKSWKDITSGGTIIRVGDVVKTEISFDSDPQTQINNKSPRGIARLI